MTPQNNNIHSGKFGQMPESLSYLAFDPVPLYRQLQVLFRKHKTNPGMSEIIRSRQDQKIPVRNLQLYVVENFAVIGWS